MINLTPLWDTETYDLIAQALDKSAQKTDRVLRREVRPHVSQRVNETLRKPPPPASWSGDNPPPWTSDLQNRAYFASNGWGGGVPMKRRSNKHVQGWHVRGDYKKNFGQITISNDEPTAVFIYGDRQQRYHALTGWPLAAPLLDEILLEAEFIFVEGLLAILWEDLA